MNDKIQIIIAAAGFIFAGLIGYATARIGVSGEIASVEARVVAVEIKLEFIRDENRLSLATYTLAKARLEEAQSETIKELRKFLSSKEVKEILLGKLELVIP